MIAVAEQYADAQRLILVEPRVGITQLSLHLWREPVAFLGPVDAHEEDVVALFDADLTFGISLCHGNLSSLGVSRSECFNGLS